MFKFIRRLFSRKGLEERVDNLERRQLEEYRASSKARPDVSVNMNNPTNFVKEASEAYWRRNHN